MKKHKRDSDDDNSSLHSLHSPETLGISANEALRYPYYTCSANVSDQSPYRAKMPGIECIYSLTTGILHIVVDDIHIRIENMELSETKKEDETKADIKKEDETKADIKKEDETKAD